MLQMHGQRGRITTQTMEMRDVAETQTPVDSGGRTRLPWSLDETAGHVTLGCNGFPTGTGRGVVWARYLEYLPTKCNTVGVGHDRRMGGRNEKTQHITCYTKKPWEIKAQESSSPWGLKLLPCASFSKLPSEEGGIFPPTAA